MSSLLERAPDLDAVFVACDVMAVGVRLLLSQMSGEPQAAVVLPAELVVGDST